MIDVLDETLLPLPHACREPALRNGKTNKPCHIAQMYRYVQHGARAVNGERVRLEVIKTPSGLRTSREAIARFIASLTDPDRPVTTLTPAMRRKQIDRACAELAEAGFELEDGALAS